MSLWGTLFGGENVISPMVCRYCNNATTEEDRP